MQSLNDFCKTLNMFQWNEIPAIYRKDEDNHNWKKECFDRDNKTPIPAELANIKGIETGIFWECRTQDKGTEREYNYTESHPTILVKFGEVIAQFSRQNRYNDKKASFFFPHFLQNKYHKLSGDILRSATKNLEKPNYIGVFTEKKVLAWIEYVRQYGEALEKANNETGEGNEAILKQIADFIATVPAAKVDVNNYNPIEPTTTVKTRYFRVTFKHYKNQAYLRTEIEYKGSLSDVSHIEEIPDPSFD